MFLSSGGDPPVAPATETITFEPADPYAVQAERFAGAVMDDEPLPIPTADAVGNMQVIDEIRRTSGG